MRTLSIAALALLFCAAPLTAQDGYSLRVNGEPVGDEVAIDTGSIVTISARSKLSLQIAGLFVQPVGQVGAAPFIIFLNPDDVLGGWSLTTKVHGKGEFRVTPAALTTEGQVVFGSAVRVKLR